MADHPVGGGDAVKPRIQALAIDEIDGAASLETRFRTQLEETHAFLDTEQAEAEGVRLRLP